MIDLPVTDGSATVTTRRGWPNEDKSQIKTLCDVLIARSNGSLKRPA